MKSIAAPLQSRRTLFAGAFVAISLFGDSYLYAVLPVYYEEAGISLLMVGAALSANRWIRFVTNPLAGVVGARIGWGVAFGLALWLAAATTAGYGLVRSALWLIVLRCLWGLCWSFLRLGGMAAVLAESPVGQRGRLMGLFTGIFRLGSVVGVAFGAYLADRLGYRETALLLGAATVAGAVIASLPGALSGRWGAPGRDEAPPPANGDLHKSWLPVGRQEWAACLSAAALHLVTSGLVTGTIGLWIKERLGAQVSVGPWLLGAATLAGLLLGSRFLIDLGVGPAAGQWADRRGRGAVLGLATAVMVAGLLALSSVGSLWLMAVAALGLFAASTGGAAVLDGWAGDLAGKSPGRFLPAYNTWIDLGAATGPLLGYWLIAQAGLGVTYGFGVVILLAAWAARGLLTRPGSQ